MARCLHAKGLKAGRENGAHPLYSKRPEAPAGRELRRLRFPFMEFSAAQTSAGGARWRRLAVALGASLWLPVATCGVARAQAAPSETAPAAAPATPSPAPQTAQTSTSPAPETNTETPPQGAPSPTGWLGFEQVQYQASLLGNVIIEDTDLGYGITDHLSADIGLPVLFTRSPFSPVLNRDYYWSGLLGEPYIDFKYSSTFHDLNYTSVLTGTMPVAGEDKIYTTGRFGVDWFNHVEESFGKFTPFINFGISNGAVNRFIMPRPYSTARPFQTLGPLGDAEGGLQYKFSRGFAKGISIGASAYALQPAGTQKVYSRYVFPYSSLAGDGHHNRYFDSSFETTANWVAIDQALQPTAVSNSKLSRDNGFSGWVEITRSRNLDVQLAYTRSEHYHLDVYTATFTFDARDLIRSVMPHRLGGGGSGL